MDLMEIELNNLLSYRTFDYYKNNDQYFGCAQFIKEMFSKIGFDVKLIDCGYGHIIYGEIRIAGESKRKIHFNGHYDTVPYDTNDKYGFNKLHNNFYGRGCSDMKAGIIAIYYASKKCIQQNIPCNISFSLVPDEEIGSCNSHATMEVLLSDLPKNTLIIIADSSYPDFIVGHRGAIWYELTIRVPSEKRFSNEKSAFDLMCESYALLKAEFPFIVAGGMARSVGAYNVFPYRFSISIDQRYDNNEGASVERDFRHKVERVMKKLEIEEYECRTILRINPSPKFFNFDKYISIAKRIIPNLDYGYGKGFYDLAWFREKGFLNSFVFGPGKPEEAHVQHETISKKNIIDVINIYTLIMKEGIEE